MSRLQSTHRQSLLAGASLAGLSAAAAIGLALAPTSVLAQTCSPDPATVALPGPDTVNCTAGTYNPGITYQAAGALTVTTSGGITVSTTAPGAPSEKGINLTATGADPITWNSTTIGSRIFGGDQTNGPVLDVLTADGNIDISVAGIDGSSATITHGVRAISTGSGSVTISTHAAGSGVVANHSGNTTGAAIEARTNTGALLLNLGQNSLSEVTFDGGPGSAVRTVSGGSATINIGSRAIVTTGVGGANPTPVNAVLDMRIDGGTMTVNNAGVITARSSDAFRPSGRAMSATGAGVLSLNNDGGIVGRVDFSDLTGGVVFVNTQVRLSGPQSDPRGWRTSGESFFSGGADILRTTSTGGVVMGITPSAEPSTLQPIGGVQTTVHFGDGDDLFDNGGRLAVGRGTRCMFIGVDTQSCSLRESTTTFTGLETFRNSGVIYLGYQETQATVTDQELSDYQPNDRLIMRGAAYIGDGGRIELDADLSSGAGQASCVGSTQSTALFYAAADCIDLRDGSTEGQTLVLLRQAHFPGGGPDIKGEGGFNTDLRTGLRGGYFTDGVVIVDVSGGTSHAGDFVLDPSSVMYTSAHGGVLDEGLFLYALVYDEANTQHVVVSLPGGAAQFGPMAQVAQGIWRSSAGSWFQRQSELRDTQDVTGLAGGFWVRGTAESAERDRVRTAVAGGTTFSLDDSYDTDAYGLTFGLDLIAAREGDVGYNLGFMGGYSHADVDFRVGPNSAAFDGFTAGLYGGVNAGGLFVDAAVSVNQMDMANTIPALGFDDVDLRAYGQVIAGSDTGSPELTNNVQSVGARVEAGWRWALSDSLFVEPLAGLDYVRTRFEDIIVRAPLDPAAVMPPVLITFDDVTSLRGAVGARLALQSAFGPVNVRYSLIGRIGNEFDGDVRYFVDNPGVDLWLGDDTSGRFGEIGGAVNIFNEAGTVSAFLTVGGEFADDFRSTSASLGGRFRW